MVDAVFIVDCRLIIVLVVGFVCKFAVTRYDLYTIANGGANGLIANGALITITQNSGPA